MLDETRVGVEFVVPAGEVDVGDFSRRRATGGGEVLGDVAKIQNGYATLADRVFVLPDSHPLVGLGLPELRPVIKGSVHRDGDVPSHHILFPYKEGDDGKWVGLLESELSPAVLEYFQQHRDVLLGRSADRNSLWFWFGRSQAIQDISKEKLNIRALFPATAVRMGVGVVPAGVGLYGTIYATETLRPLTEIREIVESDEFLEYAKEVGVDKRGNYKQVSSPMVKRFPLSL